MTDFGLARSADAPRTVYTGAQGGNPPGTIGYIAPELFLHGAVATVASDIYSFGIVIREMLTGKNPGESMSPPRFVPPLDTRWENAIQRCLEPDPERRFSGALDVVKAIRPETLPVRSLAWMRRHPFVAITAIVIFVALLGTPQITRWLTGTQEMTEIRQITNDSGLSDFPAVSHDGKLLVYSSDREGTGNLNLYLRQVDGEMRPIRLTQHDYAPSFSPEDTRIVFRSDRNGGGVYQIPTFGGEAQLLA